MTAGLRGILTSAQLLGHPLDAVGYPRVCRGPDWGLRTRLAPGYMVSGLDDARAAQVERIQQLQALPGGAELFESIEKANPPHTLEIVGVPPSADPERFLAAGDMPPAEAACRRFAALCGVVWSPPQDGLAARDARDPWSRLTRSLDRVRVPYSLLAARTAAIDAALYDGRVVLTCLASDALLASGPEHPTTELAIVVAIVVSFEQGTLARVVAAGPDAPPRVVSAAAFATALDARAALSSRDPVFAPVFPPNVIRHAAS